MVIVQQSGNEHWDFGVRFTKPYHQGVFPQAHIASVQNTSWLIRVCYIAGDHAASNGCVVSL